MHDGSVVFDTRLDNKTLERDYAKAVKKIQALENEVQVKGSRRSSLVQQADAVVGKLDEAKAKLYEMQTAGRGVFSAEQLQMQTENVAQLQAGWNGIQKRIDTYDRQIASANEKIEIQKNRAARISGEIEEATSAQRGFSDATSSAVARIEKLTDRIGKLATRALVFSVITHGFRLMRDWLGEVVTKNDQAATSVARLKGALLTMAQPLLSVVIPVFTALVNILTAVIGKIATFLSMLGGKTVKQSAAAAEALQKQGAAYGGVADAAKEAKKQLMGFDEINKLEDTSTGSGGLGGGSSGTIAPDFSWSEGVSEMMEKIAGWVLVIAAGLALWKISSYLPGTLGVILGTIGKILASVGLVAVGFHLLTAAFKDASANGMNLSNTLMMIAGIIATGLGITLLTGSLIPLLVAGIMSLLVAITYLTGNGGALIDGLKQTFGGLIEFITGVFTGDWNMAWNGLISAGRGAANVLISIINSLMDMIAAGINMISFDVPSWVPVIGGTHVGFNVVAPNIPYLADGAVIPPNREFLAVLGDQTHGNNIEAPEDLIRQIVREESGAGNSERLAQLLEILIATVEGIEVGDETIGRAAARYNRNTSRAGGW